MIYLDRIGDGQSGSGEQFKANVTHNVRDIPVALIQANGRRVRDVGYDDGITWRGENVALPVQSIMPRNPIGLADNVSILVQFETNAIPNGDGKQVTLLK